MISKIKTYCILPQTYCLLPQNYCILPQTYHLLPSKIIAIGKNKQLIFG